MNAAATWEDIQSVFPMPDNPRKNAEAVQPVADSIKRFGFGAPLVARKSDRVLIAGHTRLQAAQLLGLDKVPVRFVDLDPAEARALALADNKLGEIATWDDEQLREVIAGLESDGVDLAGIGWSDDELSALLEEPPAPEPEPDTSGDDNIPAEVEAITQAGDVVTIGRHTLHCVDCMELLRSLPDNSVDSICTDPPYGISFMGKGWDVAVPGDKWAAECLRVLKPGGHLIAFAATRTVHRLMVSLEDAGFELRDLIGWLQWQGFPKSHDASKAIDALHGAEREVLGHGPVKKTVSHCMSNSGQNKIGARKTFYGAPVSEDVKRWHGWGTALKPAHEPAVLARKPLEGTVAENLLKHGVGALNIDGCRIAYEDPAWPGPNGPTGLQPYTRTVQQRESQAANHKHVNYTDHDLGRWPANIYHCPKPSRSEREAGCDELEPRNPGFGSQSLKGISHTIQGPRLGNNHPTVKPQTLMRWLSRLITPPGGTLLEPFAGSGTTMVAAEREGFVCIAAEMEPAYCDIIRARLTHVVDGD